MRVTVYLPPYLVGSKPAGAILVETRRLDWTVACRSVCVLVFVDISPNGTVSRLYSLVEMAANGLASLEPDRAKSRGYIPC